MREAGQPPMLQDSSSKDTSAAQPGSKTEDQEDEDSEEDLSQEESKGLLKSATNNMTLAKSTTLYKAGKITLDEFVRHLTKIESLDGPRCGNNGTNKSKNRSGKAKENASRF